MKQLSSADVLRSIADLDPEVKTVDGRRSTADGPSYKDPGPHEHFNCRCAAIPSPDESEVLRPRPAREPWLPPVSFYVVIGALAVAGLLDILWRLLEALN